MTSRRDIFKSSGLLLAFSTSGVLPIPLLAQSSTSEESAEGLNSDLGVYVNGFTKSVVTNIEAGRLTIDHLNHVASATHFMARQVERSGLDQSWLSYLDRYDFTTYSSNYSENQARKAAAISGLTSDTSKNPVSAGKLTSEQFRDTKAKMMKTGTLSGIVHQTADTYLKARLEVRSAYKPAVWSPPRKSYSHLIHRQAPHFMLVCDPHAKDKKTICDHFNDATKSLEITGGVLTAIGVFCAASLVTGPLEPILCGLGAASLGLSIFFHGLALEKLVELAGC